MLFKSDSRVATARPSSIAQLFQILAIGLLMLASLGANARQFDNWVVEENSDGALASNRNNSGSVFGYACSKRNNECVFFFSPNRVNCINDEKYDLLIATRLHSSGRKVICKRFRNDALESAYIFDDLESMRRRLTESSGTMSIAQGNTEGGFNTSRFELAGILDAMDWVGRASRFNSNSNSYNNSNSNSNSNNSFNNNSNNSVLPDGSYQRTCRAMRMSGDTLVADCQDRSGAYRDTSLQRAFNCKVGIDNDDGQLTCNRR